MLISWTGLQKDVLEPWTFCLLVISRGVICLTIKSLGTQGIKIEAHKL